MKRVFALAGGSLFLFGIPLIMMLTGLTPTVGAAGLFDAISVLNTFRLSTNAGILAMWGTWVWGIGSVATDVVATWGSRHEQQTGAISSRYSLVFVIALWSVLFASKSSPTLATTAQVEESTGVPNSPVQRKPDALAPLGIGSSALLIAAVLTRVGFLRDKQLRSAPAGSFMKPLTKRAAFTWNELRHRDQKQHAKNLYAVIDALPIILPNAQVVAVNRTYETRPLANFESNAQLPFMHVPLGIVGDETVLLALAPGTRFDIVSTDISDARTAARHLIAVAQLSAYLGQIRVVVEDDSGSGGNAVSRCVLQGLSPDVAHSRQSQMVRVVIDSIGGLANSEMDLARNEAVVNICVASAHPNRLQRGANGWEILPRGEQLSVFGITDFETSALSHLLAESAKPVVSDTRDHCALLAGWNVCVRLLGPVDAETRSGETIRFEKSKSLELLAWLTTHRERPTRVAARTALWEISVQDSTFNNVVSGLRRGLSIGSDEAQQINLIPKTFTENLSIHESVVTDVDVINDAVREVKTVGDSAAWDRLHQALERVRDLPFAGADYLWPDAEGITSNCVLSVITASVMAAEYSLRRGDIRGVFWATGQGLKVLRGHEELIALRMRAYGEIGDNAGVNAEWASYERSLVHDSGSFGAASPVIMQLKRELIG